MNAVTDTVLIRIDSDNGHAVTADGMALWVGVTVEQFTTQCAAAGTEPTSAIEMLPADWIQSGQRRAREAAAAVGDNDLARILGYLANQSQPTEVLVISRSAARDD